MHLEPTVSAAATYRRATGNAKLSGTLNRIQISPFALTVDKSSLSGEAGIKLGQRPDILLVLKADSVNFDNYIAALPVEEQEKAGHSGCSTVSANWESSTTLTCS